MWASKRADNIPTRKGKNLRPTQTHASRLAAEGRGCSMQWSGRRDSNPRPSAPKADALPDCATPRFPLSIVTRIDFARRAPLEPPDPPHRYHSAADSPRSTRPRPNRFDATIDSVDGGYSSAAERLTVAQDVVGSIPTSRPKLYLIILVRFARFEVYWWANMGQSGYNTCHAASPLSSPST